MSDVSQEQDNGALWPADLLDRASELHKKAGKNRLRACLFGGAAALAGFFITAGFADSEGTYDAELVAPFAVSIMAEPFLLAGGAYNALQAKKNNQRALRFEGMALEVERSQTFEAQLPQLHSITAKMVQQAMHDQAVNPQTAPQAPPIY